MQVAISEDFISDLIKMQPKLVAKCQRLLSELTLAKPTDLSLNFSNGWRLHKLKSSPFVSISLDMNFRILAKVDGEKIDLHRLVKHDLADSPQVNRNDSQPTPIDVSSMKLAPNELFQALIEMGIPTAKAQPFSQVVDDDTLLQAFDEAESNISELALAIYETKGMTDARSRFTFIDSDLEFQNILMGKTEDWQIYLHPSQQVVVEFPANYLLAVFGSAGTGKTVCAWHRTKELASLGVRIGFVCPNQSTLEVSRSVLVKLLENVETDVFFLVPSNVSEVMELASNVDHIVIDEGQELSPKWYEDIFTYCQSNNKGITLFADLNQLGGGIPKGDKFLFEDRFGRWTELLKKFPKLRRINLSINYRNSQEIFHFYKELFSENLPYPLPSEIPVFQNREVIVKDCAIAKDLPNVVFSVVHNLLKQYPPEDIGVIVTLKGRSKEIVELLQNQASKFSVSVTQKLAKSAGVLITLPRVIRGHEKKVIIAIVNSHEENNKSKLGYIIEKYIAFSRARELLIIINS